MISTTLSSRWLIHSSASAVDSLCCIFHFSYCILQFWLVLFYIFYLFFESSHCVPPFFSWVWWASFWLLLWTLYLVICLSPYCLVLFLRICLVLLFGRCLFVSSFCLTLCGCFFVLGISARSLRLKEWPYVGVLWGPVVQSPLLTRARHSRGFPCVGYLCLPVLFGLWLVQVCWWVALAPSMSGCKAWPWLLQVHCLWDWSPVWQIPWWDTGQCWLEQLTW